jgi:hypothetical protein
MEPDGSGGYFIRFAGHAGFSYRLERTPDLSQSIPWPIILTTNAPTSGLIEFHDASPPAGQSFYRVRQP